MSALFTALVEGESKESLADMVCELRGQRAESIAALEKIAAEHDCGCRPCVGQCKSQEALQITVDYMRDIALAALAKVRS